MAIFRGRDGVVEVGTAAVLRLQSWTFQSTANIIEQDSMGDTWGGAVADINRATGEIVFYDDDTASPNGQAALTIGATVTLRLYGRGNAAGRVYRTGSAIISSISHPVQKGEIVTQTAQWVSDGAWTTATVSA
jgi:hypothetical protein